MFSPVSRKNGLKGAEDTERVGFPEHLPEDFPSGLGWKTLFQQPAKAIGERGKLVSKTTSETMPPKV
jgi:hypothetical protein